MSTINYAVEVYTDVTITDAAWGLTAGVFRWITGRPSYAGTPTYPKWEDDSDNEYVWYEDWLTRDGMSNPSRSVDISQTGDYGTNSGFSFKIRNDAKFWDYVQTNEIWLTNRVVKVYAVIDDKFYQCWDGVISNQPYSETEYEFTCVDKFKSVHREMPKYDVNPTEYPNADPALYGTAVPIVMGNVQYAKLLRVSNLKELKPLLVTYKKAKTMCCAVNYNMDPTKNGTVYAISIDLVTKGQIYHEDDLEGCYLQSILGDGADRERLTRIIANKETEIYSTYDVHDKNTTVKYSDMYITTLGLEFPIYGTTPGINGAFAWTGHYYPTVSDIDTWWFSVIGFKTELTTDKDSIAGYNRDERGNLLLYTYNKDLKRFDSATDRIGELSSTGALNLTVKASSINPDGEITVATPIPMICQNAANHPFIINTGYMSDLSYDKECQVGSVGDATDGFILVGQPIELSPISGYDYSKVSEAYLAPAVHFKAQNHANGHGKVAVRYLYGAVDVYGRAITIDSKNWYETNTIVDDLAFAAYPDPGVHSTVIPRDYFAINDTPTKMANYNYNGSDIVREGGADSTNTYEDYVARYELCRLPGEILDYLKANMLYYISVVIKTKKGSTQATNFNRFDTFCPEVGFWGIKSIGSVNEDLYVSVSGSPTNAGLPTDNVYGAFSKMLLDLDGIPATDVEFSNLPTTRSSWPVSRQITEKKSSYDYIRELAEQSFVCVYPMRTGKRKLIAWRESITDVAAHSESSILRNSIRSYDKTELRDLFNTFTLTYNFNAATNTYERSLTVTNVDAAAFPADSDPTWQLYVGGVSPNSYADAKAIWDLCHESYLKSKDIKKCPDTITKLSWYADQSSAGSTPTVSQGVSVDNSPWLFLVNLSEWSTRQKDVVRYSLPMSAGNVVLELLDHLTFSDAIFTNNTALPGWITSVELDTKNDKIDIEVTLNPIGIDSLGDIIERGQYLNIDTYTEGINQANTITEN